MFLKAVEKFPDAWELYIHGGEVCGKLEKYDEAIQYFDKAGAIGTPFMMSYIVRRCYMKK